MISEPHSALDVATQTGLAHGTASIRREDNALVFETPPDRWSYAVSFDLPPLPPPWVAEVTMAAEVGRIGVGCVNADLSQYVSGEVFCDASDGTAVCRILVDTDGARHLVIRNGTEGKAIGRIRRIQLRSISDYSRAEVKRLQAARYSYWHYAFDLGDGVVVPATLDGIMDVHRLSSASCSR